MIGLAGLGTDLETETEAGVEIVGTRGVDMSDSVQDHTPEVPGEILHIRADIAPSPERRGMEVHLDPAVH